MYAQQKLIQHYKHQQIYKKNILVNLNKCTEICVLLLFVDSLASLYLKKKYKQIHSRDLLNYIVVTYTENKINIEKKKNKKYA